MEDIEDARMLAFRTVAKSLEKFLEQMSKKYQIPEFQRHTQVRGTISNNF